MALRTKVVFLKNNCLLFGFFSKKRVLSSVASTVSCVCVGGRGGEVWGKLSDNWSSTQNLSRNVLNDFPWICSLYIFFSC